MFLIKKEDLNLLELGKIISQFMQKDLPKMNRYYNYYKGKQAINYKEPTDVGKPCNKVCVNYCSNCVETYSGYMTGIDISYQSDKNFEPVQDVLNYNDVHSMDSQMLRNALIFGRACEINWVDEDGEARFKELDPRECIDVYDDTLDQNLLYGIRFYSANYVDSTSEEYIVEVYDDKVCRKYLSTMGFSSFTLIDETPHYFGQVPMTFFSLNNDCDSIFDQIMSLNDAYNDLISGEVDSWDAFADAYLILKGVTADDDDLTAMKKNRVLMVDTDAEVSYLTKNVSDTQVENMLTNINDQIHKLALFPDFNDDKFMAQSGIAMRYKLIGFENQASSIESEMRKALQKRIELICAILNLTEGSDEYWRDVQIVFTRNLPQNDTELASLVNTLRGIVSTETLLSLLPFIKDPVAEMERVKEEKQLNMSLYSFGNTEETEVKVEENE